MRAANLYGVNIMAQQAGFARSGHDVAGDTSPRTTLLVTRFIWATMLAAEAVAFAIIYRAWSAGRFTAQPELARTVFLVNVTIFAAALPAAWFLRRNIAAAALDGLISPREFMIGTIVFLAVCEVPALLSIGSIIINQDLWPVTVVPALVGMIQLMNFPSGSLVRGIDPVS
jgi:hypothetical protein